MNNITLLKIKRLVKLYPQYKYAAVDLHGGISLFTHKPTKCRLETTWFWYYGPGTPPAATCNYFPGSSNISLDDSPNLLIEL